MLYLQKVCQIVVIVCVTAIVSAVAYVELTTPVTTQEMVETEKRHEISNALIDYKRDWKDCYDFNRSINDEEMMSEAMTTCLEELGHH